MTRHTGSSRNRSHRAGLQSVEQVKCIVALLCEVVSSCLQEWETYVPSARSAMAAFDHLHFFRDPQRFAEQVWIINGIQDFAFHDPDAGAIRDIARWCQAAWLDVLRNYRDNVETLAGRLRALLCCWTGRLQLRINLGTDHRLNRNFPSLVQLFSLQMLIRFTIRFGTQLASDVSSRSS
jgi:hypothetical protein